MFKAHKLFVQSKNADFSLKKVCVDDATFLKIVALANRDVKKKDRILARALFPLCQFQWAIILQKTHVDKKPEKKEHNFLTFFLGEKEKKGKVKAIIFKLGTRLRGNL